MEELVLLRTENSKTFNLDGRKRVLEVHVGAIHYKDSYADTSETWKDIDLTWEGNRITKAPYELTLEGNKITIRDKKTGEISTIELLEIGGKSIPAKAWGKSKGLAKAPGITTLDNIALDTDLEIVVENSSVRFARILKSDKAPVEAKFKVTGKIPFIVRAQDTKDELPVEAMLTDGILTEVLKPDRAIKYPVRIDPTWQVGASTDDCVRHFENSWFSTGVTFWRAGYWDSNSKACGGAARFLNVTIPAGSTIDSAYLVSTAERNDELGTTLNRLRAERNISPAAFSDATDFDARTWTTEYVYWDYIPYWTLDVEYTSPDIKACIQEVIDLPGWESGNPIVVIRDDFEKRSAQVSTSTRSAYSYDGSTAKAPKLVVTYTLVISGVVTLEGSGVTGATIRCINQSTNDVDTGESGAGGAYSVGVGAGTYHVVVEYESGGVKYNAKSLWDVVAS